MSTSDGTVAATPLRSPAVRDPGLQPERTALSWTRTSLAILANGLLIAGRELPSHPGQWEVLPIVMAAGSVASALVVYLIGRHRRRSLARVPLSAPVSAPRVVAATGLTISVLCVLLTLTALL